MNDILSQIYSAVLPPLLVLLSVVLGRILARAAAIAQERWGIEIEATHRDALHSALMSGIAAALSRGLTGSAAINAAVAYAAKSVPDALASLDPSSEVLTSLAEAKLRQALNLALPMLSLDPVEPIPAADDAEFHSSRSIEALKAQLDMKGSR